MAVSSNNSASTGSNAATLGESACESPGSETGSSSYSAVGVVQASAAGITPLSASSIQMLQEKGVKFFMKTEITELQGESGKVCKALGPCRPASNRKLQAGSASQRWGSRDCLAGSNRLPAFLPPSLPPGDTCHSGQRAEDPRRRRRSGNR